MEKVKRLQPTNDTLRRLYTVSGNQCAFPGCVHPMFNNQGNFVGQICHIEAALEGGERFNSFMTNETRRNFSNLMLMCYDHHIETNKEQIYTVNKLQTIKNQHESIYSNVDSFVNQMKSTIVDVTTYQQSTKVKKLSNLYINVYGSDDREKQHIIEDVDIFNNMIPIFTAMSPDAKNLFAIGLSRSKYDLNFYGNETENLFIDPYELQRVTNLDDFKIKSIFTEIERAGFLSLDENNNNENVFFFIFPKSEVNFWELIKKYCLNNNLNITDIVYNMKYTILD